MKIILFIFSVALISIFRATAENSTVKSSISTTHPPGHSHNEKDHSHDHKHDEHHHHDDKCKHSQSSSSSSESKEILTTTQTTTTNGRSKRQLPPPPGQNGVTLPPGGVTQSLASLLGIGNQQAAPLGGPPAGATQGIVQGAIQGIAQGGPAPIGGGSSSAPGPIKFPAIG